ncbi:MAG: hypothetical protein ISN64_02385 [Rickettsia sp.]|nr:hypothetical protein [Rickettsia sp.]
MKSQIKEEIISSANGKLIISGEYSAIFGAPVIACSISKETKTCIKFLKISSNLPKITVKIPQISFEKVMFISELFEHKKIIDLQYEDFLNKKLEASEILSQKTDLVKYILGYYLIKKNIQYDIICVIESNIEISFGFGSSAALILSLSLALIKLLKLNYTDQQILLFSQKIENLQHGYSSGIDIKTSFFGGIFKFADNKIHNIQIKEDIFRKFFIIKLSAKENTSITVSQVIDNFKKENNIWKKFAQIALEIEKNISNNDLSKLIENIKINNLLLKQISVVSAKNQKIISYIEKYGGAAKISGSGSLKNKFSGIIFAISEIEIIKFLSKKYNFEFESLNINFCKARYLI